MICYSLVPCMQNETRHIPDLLFLESAPAPQAHLMGVCGVGMAGVACLLHGLGWRVSGCDASMAPLASWLRELGVDVAQGHSTAHVARAPTLMIHSTAIPVGHPELQRAAAEGSRVARRGEVLARLAGLRRTLAVCGTHGKTTTATFAAALLREIGARPSWCIGGQSPQLGAVAGLGDSDLLVVEADESDGTLACYEPAVTIITNVEFDHMEHFADVTAFESCFRRVIGQTRERVVFCAEDPRATRLAASATHSLSYGLGPHAEIHAAKIDADASGSSFSVCHGARELGRVRLGVPGEHNILNALGAVAGLLALGQDAERVVAAINRLSCLPDRRFDRVVTHPGVTVISDYAHHPTEIRALVGTAAYLPARRRIAVFQPHRYTRTLALGDAFAPAFEGVDEVILVPVYAASEAPVRGGRSEDLYARFCRTRPPDTVRLAHSLQEAWRLLTDCVETGDLVLIVGAGDVVSLAERARREWAVSTPATIRGLNRDDSEAIVQTPASEKEPAVAALPRKDGTSSSPPLAVEIRPDRERES